jgi:hypothetical protein
MIVNDKIEWTVMDLSLLIRLIESSVHPSSGDLFDAIEDGHAPGCHVE